MTASLIPLWLVTATIGEHNNAQFTLPAENIVDAGDHAGIILEFRCEESNSRIIDYQIQSITQLT